MVSAYLSSIKKILRRSEIRLVGVAGTADCFPGIHPSLHSLVSDLPYAITFGVIISSKVLASLHTAPNQLYAFHYARINQCIDLVQIQLTNYIEAQGYQALPVGASHVLNFDKMTAHLSHRAFAVQAGLGWIGRHNLLVTPAYGAGVRLGTVLTDLPLPQSPHLTRDCGRCTACIAACPAGAIKERREDFDQTACLRTLQAFSKIAGINHLICGLCVKACQGMRGKK